MESPPRLVDAVLDWCKYQFAKFHLKEITQKVKLTLFEVKRGHTLSSEGQYELNNSIVLQRQLSRIVDSYNGAELDDSNVTTIKVNLSGWKYAPMLEKRIGEDPQIALGRTRFSEIQVFFNHGGKPSGAWIPAIATLTVIFPLNAYGIFNDITVFDRYDAAISQITSTVKHECIHIGQTILNELLELRNYSGLPTKKLLNKDYTPVGRYKSDPSMFIQHELRDVEFKTNLSNAIHHFLGLSKRIPTDKLREAIRIYIRDSPLVETKYVPDSGAAVWNQYPTIVTPSTFFFNLKMRDYAKWKQAISEFYDALSRAGLPV